MDFFVCIYTPIKARIDDVTLVGHGQASPKTILKL